MNKFRFILFSLFAIASCVSCSKDDEDGVNYAKKYNIVLSDRQQVLRDSSNIFANDLYKALCGKIKADNFVVSPLSASFALSMLANGASEEAQAEITSALGMKDFSIEELNEYNKLFVDNLPKMDPKAALSIANLLWLQDAIEPQAPFVNAMKQSYNSAVLITDDNKGIPAVNEWVKKATNGNIPQILPDDGSLKLKNFALVNALTFYGQWASPFEEKNTKSELFTNADDSKSTVKMMNHMKRHIYYETPKMAMAEFPYGDLQQNICPFVLSVALPMKDVSLDECMEELLTMDLSGEGKVRDLIVKMPKVNLVNHIDLVSVFQSLGINKVFSKDHLKGIGEPKNPQDSLVLKLAKQSAILKIDEKGTVASAVTVAGDVNAMSPPMWPGEFFIDRPFVFAIKAKDTNVVLFMGKITKL